MSPRKRGNRKGTGKRRGHPRREAERREARGSPRKPALGGLAGTMAREVAQLECAMDAERWASGTSGVWLQRSPFEAKAAAGFAAELVEQLERKRALAALRALAAVSSEDVMAISGEAADRLAAAGVPEPGWVGGLGAARPRAAALMREGVFDDGVNVLVEFDHPEEVHVLGVYVDHSLGVMAKDALLGGTLEQIAQLTRESPSADMLRIEPIALEQAAARIAQAIDRTDHTLEPPVGDDYWELRALIGARLRALPGGGAAAERPELSFEERESLVDDFLASPQAKAVADDEWADEIAGHAVGFCCDYVDGRPLRWSPVVVELFMHWLPAKVLAPRAMFERVPDVLPAWIRYCGRVRGVPEGAVEETVASIDRWVEDMLAGAGDVASFSPAKAFGAAMREADLDIGDPAAVDAFVRGWNASRDER